MNSKALPQDIEAIVGTFREAVKEIDPHIVVSGKLVDKKLTMEATIPAEHQVPGANSLKRLEDALKSGQIEEMLFTTIALENPRSAAKSKLVYTLDVTEPEEAHAYVLADKGVILNDALQKELVAQVRQGIKQGHNAEMIKMLLVTAEAKATGSAQVSQWSQPELQNQEKVFSDSVEKYLTKGGDPGFITHAFQTAQMFINQRNIDGVWNDPEDKGRAR